MRSFQVTPDDLIVAPGESKTTPGGVFNSIVIGDGSTLTLQAPAGNLIVAPGESKTTPGWVFNSIVIGNGGTLTLQAPLGINAPAPLTGPSSAAEPDRSIAVFNMLADDGAHRYAPEIRLSDHRSEKLQTIRNDRLTSYSKIAGPHRLGAMVVANLGGQPIPRISEDMPVGVSIGGFAFQAVLGSDATRQRDRAGKLMPFDEKKKSALFYLTTNTTSLGGLSPSKRLGYVRFSCRAYASKFSVK